MAGYSRLDLAGKYFLSLAVLGIIILFAFFLSETYFYPDKTEEVIRENLSLPKNIDIMQEIPIHERGAVWPSGPIQFVELSKQELLSLPQAEFYMKLEGHPDRWQYIFSGNQELHIIYAAIDKTDPSIQYRHTQIITCPLKNTWAGFYRLEKAEFIDDNVEAVFVFTISTLLGLAIFSFCVIGAFASFSVFFYGPIRVLSGMNKEAETAEKDRT